VGGARNHIPLPALLQKDNLQSVAAGYLSPRTLEVHRARVMDKLGAKNAADLVRIVLRGGRGHERAPIALPRQ